MSDSGDTMIEMVSAIPVTISAIRQASPSVKLFTLDTDEDRLEFHSGQWVDCYVDVDGEQLVGGYSLTSSPLVTGSVELAVKQARENTVTRYLHERAAVGDGLYLAGGQGGCYYTAGMARSLFLIAGGIGITPLISILRYVSQADPEVAVTLLYSASSPEELIFRDEIERLAAASDLVRCEFTVTHEMERRRPGDGSGRIDANMLSTMAIDPAALCFLCGPSAMIDDLSRTLVELGVEQSRIRYEKWW